MIEIDFETTIGEEIEIVFHAIELTGKSRYTIAEEADIRPALLFLWDYAVKNQDKKIDIRYDSLCVLIHHLKQEYPDAIFKATKCMLVSKIYPQLLRKRLLRGA